MVDFKAYNERKRTAERLASNNACELDARKKQISRALDRIKVLREDWYTECRPGSVIVGKALSDLESILSRGMPPGAA